MDEFGTPLRGVSELGGAQGVDAPTASVSRLQNRHPLSRAAEFACGHQARGTCSDNDDMLWAWKSHTETYRPAGEVPAFWIRYRSSVTLPSRVWLLSRVIAATGAR